MGTQNLFWNENTWVKIPAPVVTSPGISGNYPLDFHFTKEHCMKGVNT